MTLEPRRPTTRAVRTLAIQQEVPILRTLTVIAALLALTTATAAQAKERKGETVKAYAQRLAAQEYGWTGYEWYAVTQIVGPESSWDPCAYYPSQHDCFYKGDRSCGVPQATPCPKAWKGRLWVTRYEQVRWLMRYLHGRYGTPGSALNFRRARGYY